jgi:hypothetical protein
MRDSRVGRRRLPAHLRRPEAERRGALAPHPARPDRAAPPTPQSFYALCWRPRRAAWSRQPCAPHAPARLDALDLFRRFVAAASDASQLETYLKIWFQGMEWDKIRRGNMEELMAYGARGGRATAPGARPRAHGRRGARAAAAPGERRQPQARRGAADSRARHQARGPRAAVAPAPLAPRPTRRAPTPHPSGCRLLVPHARRDGGGGPWPRPRADGGRAGARLAPHLPPGLHPGAAAARPHGRAARGLRVGPGGGRRRPPHR